MAELKLRKKARLFAKFYAISENGTQSVKQAGYDVKNDNVAGVIASKNIRNVKIIKAIELAKMDFAKEIPDKLVKRTHIALMKKKEIINGVKTDQPHADVKEAIKMAYLLKGSFAPTKNINVTATLREALGILDDDGEAGNVTE